MTDIKQISILGMPDRIQIISGSRGQQHTFFLEEQSDVSVNFSKKADRTDIYVSANQTPVSFVKCRWYCKFPIGTKFLGDAHERAYGNLQFEGFRPERIMPWYFTAVYGDAIAGFGVKVRPNTFVSWQTDPSGITLWLDMRCGSNGYQMDGKEILAASIVEQKGSGDVFVFLQEFCKKMGDSPVLPQFPVYGFNNWYYAYGNSSYEQIIRDTDLLVSLTENLDNRPFMVIDDGWQLGSTNGQCTGTLGTLSNYKFGDMKALADDMKKRGVHPGIWLRPLKFNPEWKDMSLALSKDPTFLDPSLDESLELIAADIERITGQWGYELVKYDYTTCDIFGRFHSTHNLQLTDGMWSLKRQMTNAMAIKRLYQTIYDHSHGAVIIGCNCVSHLGAGYFQLHRSGDDTSGREWERTRKMGINTLAFRLPQHKAFFDVDADCVGINGTFDWKLNREWLKLLAGSATPLFVSANPDCMTPEIIADLKAAFIKAEKQQGSCKPCHLTETTMPTVWEIDGETVEFAFDDIMGADYTLAN